MIIFHFKKYVKFTTYINVTNRTNKVNKISTHMFDKLSIDDAVMGVVEVVVVKVEQDVQSSGMKKEI